MYVASLKKRWWCCRAIQEDIIYLGFCFDLNSLFVEALAVSVTHDAIAIRLIVLYDPPKTPKGTDFFNDLADILHQYSLMSG